MRPYRVTLSVPVAVTESFERAARENAAISACAGFRRAESRSISTCFGIGGMSAIGGASGLTSDTGIGIPTFSAFG